MVYKSVKQQKLDDERKKENAKLACRRYRANMSEDKKAAYNEKARIRNQKRRDRLKAEPANGRNVTRSKAQKKHERKEKQRIRMKVYKANTIHQKKEAIKKRD